MVTSVGCPVTSLDKENQSFGCRFIFHVEVLADVLKSLPWCPDLLSLSAWNACEQFASRCEPNNLFACCFRFSCCCPQFCLAGFWLRRIPSTHTYSLTATVIVERVCTMADKMQVDEPVRSLQGFLWKQGNKGPVKRWRKRWFSLKDEFKMYSLPRKCFGVEQFPQ